MENRYESSLGNPADSEEEEEHHRISVVVMHKKWRNPGHVPSFLLLFNLLMILLTTQRQLLPSVSAAEHTKKSLDGVAITIEDFQTLNAFKRAVDPRGIFLSTWKDARRRHSPCSGNWTGVKCINGRVIAIQLPFKGLAGSITPEIGHLTSLRKLSLHDNSIGGSIPTSIGQLTNLRGLYLFNNRLSGSIPPSIGNIPSLRSLDLSRNFLNGSFPPSLAANATTNLHRLNFSFNYLSGPIPAEFTVGPSLTFLALQHNNLSGPIPSTWGRRGREEESSRDNSEEEDNTTTNGFQLQVLTLDHNLLTGKIPPSLISKFTALRVLSLSRNHITGHIPDEFGKLENLTALDLSNNNFTGGIPSSLSALTNLTSFNISHNDLSGQVPSALSRKFDSSAFTGNLQLCGYRNSPPCAAPPPPPHSSSQPPAAVVSASHHHNHRKLSTKDIILILIGAAILAISILLCVLGCCLLRRRSKPAGTTTTASTTAAARGEKAAAISGSTATEASGSGIGGGVGGGKLVLFDVSFEFTADDLLCATAEIIGKSAFGTAYKATMENGNQVAVKRLREKLAKSSKEFEVEIAALGRIRHPNLLPLRAYYLGPKGEKLLVYDYLPNGTLSAYLHASRPETVMIINWPTRMKIMLGITRGLHHLHSNEGGGMIHGNLTSSDVYLDDQTNPKIGDYGLTILMTETATMLSATAGSTGYRAPEVQKTKNPATAKADIYSLGVIMLELLTGRSPAEAIDGVDLPQWVASNVREEWSTEVFDSELAVDDDDDESSRDEMLNALKLALHLVDPSPDDRPDAAQALKQLEEISPHLAAAVAPETVSGGDEKNTV